MDGSFRYCRTAIAFSASATTALTKRNARISYYVGGNRKIEAYVKENCGGHIRAAYGCSLGGSFVGLLAARQKVHIDYGILGSSDLDQASPFVAKLQTDLLLPLIYPLLRDGQFKSRLLKSAL